MKTSDEANKENEWLKFLQEGGNPILKKETPKPKRIVSVRQQRAVRSNSK